jgi:Myosin-like coiled-coil protein
LTPEEKTAQYKQMQLEVFKNFVKDFEEEERSLLMDESDPAFFAERQRDLEKREREEIKRLEKQVFKKDLLDVEEAYVHGNLKQLRERMLRSINEGIAKQQRFLARVQALYDEESKISQKKKADIQATMNKKNMLAKLCTGLLEKNCELYHTHETMLEEERKQRQVLAANFGDQMKEVQVELDAQKTKRQAEIEENGELRKKIQVAIDAYREKEGQYRAKMEGHQKMILDLEKKLKTTIEGTVTKTIKEAETEKAKFVRVCESVKDLSTKINSFM